MENNSQLLTIAIPTYNRSHYLKECLHHVCSQINDEVKVVVRDNCSTNYNYDSFIKPYVDKYGVIAKRNIVNVGGDLNIARLFEECDTKWLLVLGDDDYLMEGSIESIVKVLKEHPDDIFIKFNSSYDGRAEGVCGFAKAMSGKFEFLSSFFTSEGIHNIEKTRQDIYVHYKYISLKMAQIIRVMIHLRGDENSSCFFTSKPILMKHGEDITWDHSELIIPYLTLFDIFWKEKGLFKNNIFRTIAGTLFRYISMSNLSFSNKYYYYKQVIIKYGVVNTIRYCYRSIVRVVLYHLLGDKYYTKVTRKS